MTESYLTATEQDWLKHEEELTQDEQKPQNLTSQKIVQSFCLILLN